MIQRIQTVFFALVIVLGIVFSFVPILSFNADDVKQVMQAYKTVNAESAEMISKNMGVGVLQGIVILVSAILIFMFKNRSLQMKLGKLNILFLALQIAAIVMYSDVAKSNLPTEMNNMEISIEFGAIIPLLSLILTYLGIRFIKKDDELIRSADRLR